MEIGQAHQRHVCHLGGANNHVILRAPNAVITLLRFDYDTTIRLRSDYDVSRAPASIRRDSTRAKNEHVIIFCRSRIS